MNTKMCGKCGQTKSWADFNMRSDGSGPRYRCKECHKEQSQCYYQANKEKCLQAGADWQKNNRPAARAKAKRHRDADPKKQRDRNKKYRDSHNTRKPIEIERAHHAVRVALKTGEIKAQPCFVCGAAGESHHSSYDEPMRKCVTWLCRAHHQQLHAEHRCAY